MRKIAIILLLAMIATLSGCEWSGTDPEVVFVNQSSYTVSVRPNGQEFWMPFEMAPGQEKSIGTDRQVFFFYEPMSKVEVGYNEKARIVFIDIDDNTIHVKD